MNAVEVTEAEIHCIDAECDGTVEVEMDGDLTYNECDECGSTWGFMRVNSEGEFCQVGIPEQVRRAASSDVFDPKPKTIPLQVKR